MRAQLKQLRLAPPICVSLEIIAISSDYTHFTWNHCNWLRPCIFQLEQLHLAQNICLIGLKQLQLANICNWFRICTFQFIIVAISSDHAHSNRNKCNWLKLCTIESKILFWNNRYLIRLCAFHLRSLQLAQNMHDSL